MSELNIRRRDNGRRGVARLVAIGLLSGVAAGLFGCGGGGGGGGGGGDVNNSGDYSISPTSLSFSATENGTTPSSKTIQATSTSGLLFISVSTTGPVSATTNPNGTAVATVTVTPGTPSVVGV